MSISVTVPSGFSSRSVSGAGKPAVPGEGAALSAAGAGGAGSRGVPGTQSSRKQASRQRYAHRIDFFIGSSVSSRKS